MPKISVIVPNYNHQPFLNRRIQSILNQTEKDFELILLDDHSSDHSIEILNHYVSNSNCRLLVNERNSGNPYKQWNKGIREAAGDYIWIAESDDYADATFLEKMVSKLDQAPQAGLAYCQSWIVDEHEQPLGLNDGWTQALAPGRWQHDFFADGRQECRDFLILQNTIPNASAVLFRRAVFERAGWADETFFYAGDWHLWARMLAFSDVCFCSEPLNFYRTHSATLRSKESTGIRGALECYRVLAWMLAHVDVPAERAEKALDLAMSRWQRALTVQSGGLSSSRNREVFRVARRVDRHLARRFVRHSLARLCRKLPCRRKPT